MIHTPFPTFQTYYTRAFQDDDVELLYQLRSNFDVQKHHPHGTFSREKTIAYFNELKNHFKQHKFSYLPIFEKSSNRFIGTCGLMFFDAAKENFHDDKVQLGYALLPEFWGKGVATILGTEFLKWGFANLPINEIIAVCNPVNLGSIKVLEKLGGKYVETVTNPRAGDVVSLYKFENNFR